MYSVRAPAEELVPCIDGPGVTAQVGADDREPAAAANMHDTGAATDVAAAGAVVTVAAAV
jgi:hypothetical protein